MLDIAKLMLGLSKARPIFHSEADFQHAFAWQIHENLPDCQIRLEYNPRPAQKKRMYLDVWVRSLRVAIELKYLTRKLELEWENELFALRNQAAQDISRYDYCKDVQRLEQVAVEGIAKAGIAILLTNDSSYWRTAQHHATADADFRLEEGRKLSGSLAWSNRAGAGTTKGREEPIEIDGSYDLTWRDYSRPASTSYEQFRFLTVCVKS